MRKRKAKTTPFGISLVRSQVLCLAAQGAQTRLEISLHNHLSYTSTHCHQTLFLLMIQIHALQSPDGILAADGSFDACNVLRLHWLLQITTT